MRKVLIVAALALLTSLPANAAAYYVGEIGARSLARGGANLVRPSDPSAAWLNPATLTLASGVQLDIDLNLVFLNSQFIRDCGGIPEGCKAQQGFSRTYKDFEGNDRFYEVKAERPPPDDNVGPADVNQLGQFGTPSRFDGATPIRNQAGVQPVPRLMVSFNSDSFGFDGVALGAYVYAPNNGDYAFGADTPTRYTLIDRDLLEVYYGLAAAYRFENWIAVGAGLQFVTAGVNQRVRLTADQYGNEDPDFDIQVHIDGIQHLIPSGNFGVWTNPGAALGIGDLEFAGSVQLSRSVRATGPITIESIGPRFQEEFGDLVTFSAEGAQATAEFTLAPFYRVGTRYGNGDKDFAYDVEADFVYEQWSVYDHVFLGTQGVLVDRAPNDDQPGEELPPVIQPKDWNDAWSVRLGTTLAFFDRQLEVHGGGYYETSAIPNETYSVELVDGDKVGVGVGVSGKLAGVRLDVGYGHVFIFDRTVGNESIVFNGSSGPSPLMGGADPQTRVAMGKYSAGFDMINVGLNVGFDELFGFGKYAQE
jgi:long-subunit fatty acid transport protein